MVSITSKLQKMSKTNQQLKALKLKRKKLTHEINKLRLEREKLDIQIAEIKN